MDKTNYKPDGFFSIEWEISELRVSFTKSKRCPIIGLSGHSYFILKEIWDWELINIQEQVMVLFLNNLNEVIGYKCVFTGTGEKCLIDVKLILGFALGCLAKKIIVAHNHPCGKFKPSRTDNVLTQELHDACKIMDVIFLDHLIISEYGYYSYGDEGKL